MSYKKPILIVSGEPRSIFLEIFFKSLKKGKFKKPLILISSLKLVKMEMKKLKYKFQVKILNKNNFLNEDLNNNQINLININYNGKKKRFISTCFQKAFEILKKNNLIDFINGPINKKLFLNKNFPGVTEYIANKFKIKNYAMLIYNKNLAVSPLTTHLPLKKVTKKIEKSAIIKNIKLIDNFYKLNFKKKPKIAVLGLNPHCESISKFNEDEKIIKPAVNLLKKQKYNVSGPFSADTIFLSQNRKEYDVILGMYHDQVLTPIKTLYEYDAINITLGLPFLRISPDHGPNKSMYGKNISNPTSLIRAISFLDKN